MSDFPNEWKITKVENMASVERGKFSARPRNDPRYYGGKIPFVQTGDIREANTFLEKYSQTLNDEGLSVSRLFPAETVFITIAANIGDVAITKFEVACPDSIVAVQANDDVSPYWLLYALEIQQPRLDYIASQNAQKNINLKVLRPLKVLVPPLEEQKRIAAILGTWDSAIAQVEALVSALERRKKGLMQGLLTGEVRFAEFVESDEMQETRFGDIPADWDNVQLSDLFKRVRRKAGEDELEVLSITAGTGFQTQEEKFGRIIAGKNLSNYIELHKGEFAYNKGNSNTYPQGCVYLLEEYERAAVPSVYYCFKSKDKNIELRFYKHYFESGALNKQLSTRINTGVRNDGLLNLYVDDFFDVEILVPAKNEQKHISHVLSKIDDELDIFQEYLICLREQKKGLMQRLLTGEIRVQV